MICIALMTQSRNWIVYSRQIDGDLVLARDLVGVGRAENLLEGRLERARVGLVEDACPR